MQIYSKIGKPVKLTSIAVDSISLTMVLGNFVVNEAHNIGPDRGLEDSRKANRGISSLVLFRIHGNLGTRRGQRLKENENC